jgi:hypothetical protein
VASGIGELADVALVFGIFCFVARIDTPLGSSLSFWLGPSQSLGRTDQPAIGLALDA